MLFGPRQIAKRFAQMPVRGMENPVGAVGFGRDVSKEVDRLTLFQIAGIQI